MRPHWTLRYITDRICEWIFHRTHPGAPWLGPDAVKTLDELLRPHFTGLEAGAGRSTPWIASRVKQLTSLEENEAWLKRVAEMLRRSELYNVELIHINAKDGDLRVAYLAEIDRVGQASLDFATVDSEHERAAVALGLLPKLKPGGFLMLDNANWFLPSDSRSPASRGIADDPLNADWELFAQATKTWTRRWTSSGVTDTAFFFKPAAD
jgi:hypothetical protein